MKQTSFVFQLRTLNLDFNELAENLRNAVSPVQGVEDITFDRDPLNTIRICVGFDDAEDAKKIHRKLGRAIARLEGVSIARCTTNLAEIFG